MRRTFWFKPIAVAMGLWFSLFIGEPSLVSPCAMHGALAHQASTAETHHGSAAHHGSAPSQPGSEHAGCQCIGACTTGLAPLPPDQSRVVAFGVTTYDEPDTPSAAEARPPQAPAFARPYTTGPPRVTA